MTLFAAVYLCTIARCKFKSFNFTRVFPMSVRSMPLILITTFFIVFAATFPGTANATVVRVETVLGEFEINLYDMYGLTHQESGAVGVLM